MRRTLIYKRTHPGDPDREGRFGIHDCMGRVRTWGFGAVIGVGGDGAQPKKHGLDRKVNWIGIGPRKRAAPDKRGPVLTFKHFRLFGPEAGLRAVDGPNFPKLAPQLAARIYSNNTHFLMNHLNEGEQREVKRILALAKNARPSSADGAGPVTTAERCMPRTPPAKSIKGCSS